MKSKIHGRLLQIALRYHGTLVKPPGGNFVLYPEVKSTTGYQADGLAFYYPLSLYLSTGVVKEALF